MTYAPASILSVRAFLIPITRLSPVSLGIVGDTAHAAKGTSYHLGADKLSLSAYSRRTARDRAGLTNAASALDIGRFPDLRTFSVRLVARCRANAPGTSDIREVIYSPDGRTVLRWDRERGRASMPRAGEADNSHLFHTHVSWYRDSERRSKVGVFMPLLAVWAPEILPELRTGPWSAYQVSIKLRSVGVNANVIGYRHLVAGLRARRINFGTSVQLIDLRAFMTRP